MIARMLPLLAAAFFLLPGLCSAADEAPPDTKTRDVIAREFQALLKRAENLTKGIHEPVAPPAITKVSDVIAFGNHKAAARPLKVKVKGVVTFVDPSRPWFFLQDATAATVVTQGFGAVEVHAGQLVEAEGTLRPGSYSTYVDLAMVTVTGTAPLPVPRKGSTADVRAQRLFSYWTETEGVLRNSLTIADGKTYLLLCTRQGNCVVVVHGAGPDFDLRAMEGARLRVRGVNWLQFEGNLQALPGPDNISVVTPGPARAFDRPAVDAADLPDVPAGDAPEKVNAVCLITDVIGRVRLQAADGTPIISVPLVFFGVAGTQSLPPVAPAPGDAVEILSAFSRENGMLIARDTQFRVTGNGQPVPWPLSTTPAGAADPARTARLLTLRGRLTGTEFRTLRMYGPPWSTLQIPVLRLEEDGAAVEVYGTPDSAKDFSALPVDNIVQVTGYHVSGKNPQLWLRTPADLTNAGRSAKAIMQSVWWALAGLTALIVAGGGFIWALREKLKRQRNEAAIVSAHNATLEARVAERTADLAAANERLTRASDEAVANFARERELGDLRSNFVSMVSHEFRTPLAVILSSTELLTNHLDRLPPERRAQQLASIRGSTQQMARLIEEVLLLGKVEAGRITFAPVPLNLREFLSELVDEALSATARHCPISLHCAEALPEIIRADPALLRHIFSNLLSNASKYSPEGSEVRLSAEPANSAIVFRITDKGIGIPVEDLPHLFEPFHRAKNVGQVSGTGLGLMITKRCVELHGADIEVRSRPGEGTSVAVQLRVES